MYFLSIPDVEIICWGNILNILLTHIGYIYKPISLDLARTTKLNGSEDW